MREDIIVYKRAPIVLTKDAEWFNRTMESAANWKPGAIILLPEDALIFVDEG